MNTDFSLDAGLKALQLRGLFSFVPFFLLPSSLFLRVPLPHYHHRRAEDAVVQLVAALDLREDLAALAVAVGDGLVVARVEGLAFGLDGLDAGVLQELL